jgi:hypothetical protein
VAKRNGLARPNDVDLEACPCVDGGHWFDPFAETTVYHVKQKGALRGMAVRTMTCERYGVPKDQPLTWDGRIAGGSTYDYSATTYIEEARKLGDHHDRAPAMRKVLLDRARRDLADELAESA